MTNEKKLLILSMIFLFAGISSNFIVSPYIEAVEDNFLLRFGLASIPIVFFIIATIIGWKSTKYMDELEKLIRQKTFFYSMCISWALFAVYGHFQTAGFELPRLDGWSVAAILFLSTLIPQAIIWLKYQSPSEEDGHGNLEQRFFSRGNMISIIGVSIIVLCFVATAVSVALMWRERSNLFLDSIVLMMAPALVTYSLSVCWLQRKELSDIRKSRIVKVVVLTVALVILGVIAYVVGILNGMITWPFRIPVFVVLLYYAFFLAQGIISMHLSLITKTLPLERDWIL